MTTIEVMRKALEALEYAEKDAADFQRINTDQTGAAIAALRAEIERLEAAEPVAARPACLDGKCPDRRECDVARACLHHTAPTPPAKPTAAEPVAEVYNPWRHTLENCASGDNYLSHSEYHELIKELDDLYRLRAAPPAAIPALTDEECEIRNRDPHTEWDADMRWAYALAAERAGVEIKH